MLYEITVVGFLLLAPCLLSVLVAFMARDMLRDSEQIKAGLAAVRSESMALWAFVWVAIAGIAAVMVAVWIGSAVAWIALIGTLL